MEEKSFVETTEAQVSKKSEILDNIFEFLPSETEEEVTFPSRALYYNTENTTKPVTIRPMTFEDEKALIASVKGSDDPMNLMLRRCVSNININQLFLFDKVYLIFKLREISYGKEFSATVTCPSCREESSVMFDITQLPINLVPEDWEVPVIIELPTLKKSAKIAVPRNADESYFTNAESSMNNMWRFILEIDGHSNPEIISEVLKKLPLQDVHAIIKVLNLTDYGVQTKVKYLCNNCQEVTVMELPLTTDFFTVS